MFAKLSLDLLNMLSLNVIIYTFLVLTFLYIVVNYKALPKYDIIILVCALLVALVISVKCSFTSTVEKFTDITQYKRADFNEDITDISDKLKVYLSIYNTSSFNNMGRTWSNIAPSDKALPPFSFELNPVYSKKTGLYMGNNRVVGPLSSDLNIQFNNTYTIAIACKHGNLMVNNTNTEIELLKLYANSPNNNGLSLFIQSGSVVNTNNSQVGNLLLQYTDNDALPCLANVDDKLINLDKDVLTFYFIVKDTDNVRVLMMNETTNTITTILKFTIRNSNTTFSNKEMVMNRLVNWNGNIFNFAIFDTALSDARITTFYTHIMKYYYMNIDPGFTEIMNQYNDILSAMQKLSKCSFDAATCNTCASVIDWTDIGQLLNTSDVCKKAIDKFCTLNTTSPACKCWDTNNAIYNTDSCRLYRNIFNQDKTTLFDALSAENLDYIKNKYGLIYPKECPTATTKAEYIHNSYPEYDLNRLQVSIKPPKEVKSVPFNGDDGEKQVTEDADTSVTNYIKNDPRLNNDISNLPNKIVQQQQAYIDRNTKMTPTKSKDLPPPDTFFSKFMKVILPSSS
jgi:hypothetical protein